MSGFQNILNKINLLQNRGIRIIAKLSKMDHISDAKSRLEIEDLGKRRLKHLIEMSFSLSKHPENLKRITRNTRYNSNKKILFTDTVHTDIYKRSSHYKCRIIWNNLPYEYHHIEDLAVFRSMVSRNIETLFENSKGSLKNT